MVIAMIVISSSVVMLIVNIKSTTKFELGTEAYAIAESGAENAVLRILRNPNYSGETLTVGNGIAEISVNGSTQKTILSVGKTDNFVRKVQVVVVYVNNIATISSWMEVP